MYKITINGKLYEEIPDSTILKACQNNGIYIPTLCSHNDLPPSVKCKICVVKTDEKNFNLSCNTKIEDGMIIDTQSPDVKKKALDNLLSFNDLPLMPNSKEIENIWKYFNPKRPMRGRAAEKTTSISFDPDTCVNCARCTKLCSDVQCIGALDDSSQLLSENDCIQCGLCITVCPTPALTPKSAISDVLRAMSKGKLLMLQISSLSSVSLGEMFGFPIGTDLTKKIIGSVRELGFKYVFDINFGGDIATIEEANDLLRRMETGEDLPMFSSSCPGWVNFVEKLHPELCHNITRTKSPSMISASLIRNYFIHKNKIDDSNIFLVSVMPCTAKKDEAVREQLSGSIDVVLTTVELGEMFKKFYIDLRNVNDSFFDDIKPYSSSAFFYGSSGGETECIFRHLSQTINNTTLPESICDTLRSDLDLKILNINIKDLEFKVAVCNGISVARELVESGRYKEFHYIEVMACYLGCMSGGGQPKLKFIKDSLIRQKTLYSFDRSGNYKPTPSLVKDVNRFYEGVLDDIESSKKQNMFQTFYKLQKTTITEMKRRVNQLPIVVFGSSGGNASRLARTFASYIGTIPFQMNLLSINQLLQTEYLIIFCSTFGDGNFPDNAQKFVKMLEEIKDLDLSKLSFCICALGSREHAHFCASGKKLYKLLRERNANNFIPLLELDTSSPDKGEGFFESWSLRLVHKLGFRIPDITIEPQYVLKIDDDINDPIQTAPDTPIGFSWGYIENSAKITPDNCVPKMHKYQIKIPATMKYECGDYLAILAKNDNDTVDMVLKALNLDGNAILTVSTKLPEGYNLIPPRVTIKELFSQYIDLCGIPTRNLLRAYKQYTTNSVLREKFERILTSISQSQSSSSENQISEDLYAEFVKDTSVVEFIIEYSKYGYPPLNILITAIPHIHPRLYCISSSFSSSTRLAELIVTDNIFGNGRRGFCSSYLSKFGLSKVAVKIQKGIFAYPKDPTTPIILVTFSYGISPILSVLQHRESIGTSLGKTCLFLGKRYKSMHPLIDAMISGYVDQGILQDLFVCYYNGPTKKTINDLMRESADTIWTYWQNPKTILFYCGPPKKTPTLLFDTLVQITMDKTKSSKEEAEKFCKRHVCYIESF